MRRLTEIAPGLLLATSECFVTSSVVVAGNDGGCLVIDPAVTIDDLAGLVADLDELGLRPVAGFATHPHWDHILWTQGLGDVPRYASAEAVRVAERERSGLIEGVQQSAPGHDLGLFGRLVPVEAAGQTSALAWNGPPARVVTHAGHAPGHSAVFLPDSGTLVAGDMCSDIEIPLLDTDQADPVGDYRAGLRLLADLPVRLVIPGHGHTGDAGEFRRRVAADLAYLDDLERGPDTGDPRLAVAWLQAEHSRQAAHLHP
jgi:glyoxylase-like metal-dependent hydrolase (beta-lactamase superfamily II)